LSGDRGSGNDDEMGASIGNPARVAFQQRLVQLTIEHRDLDTAIERLAQDPGHDELQLRRLKRRKLLLKDQIAFLQRQFDPDVPA
jgi:hypothetical protein